MRDGVSVNNVAIQTFKIVYLLVINICCFSHTIDHVRVRFETPGLSEFITLWICT